MDISRMIRLEVPVRLKDFSQYTVRVSRKAERLSGSVMPETEMKENLEY